TTWIVRDHIHSRGLRRQERHHVNMMAACESHFAMPVRCVDVPLTTHCEQMPAHSAALIYNKAGEIAENVSIDGVHHAAFLALLLIENHEQGHEFLVNIFGRTIGFGFSSGSNDDRPDQAGVDFIRLVNMTVIRPHDGAGLTGPGSTV